MTEDENKLYQLYQYVDDVLTSLRFDLEDGIITDSEYISKTQEHLNRYQMAEGMSKERGFLEFRIENSCIDEEEREKLRKRISEIDDDEFNEIINAILTKNESDLDEYEAESVECDNQQRRIKYQRLASALKSGEDNNTSGENEADKKPGETKSKKPAGASNIKAGNTLNDYLNYVRSAFNCGLGKCIYGVTLCIHSDDDLEYYNSLSSIYSVVFSGSGEKRINQHSLSMGARRYDAPVEQMFKHIADNNEGIESIDISNFSAVDPLFLELIQVINSASSNAKKIFAVRIKANDKSTTGLIASKIPTYEIIHTQKSPDEYAEKLYTLFPARVKSGFSDLKETLKKIISAEMNKGCFTGEKSLEYIALNLAYYVNVTSGKNIKITDDVLSDFYKNSYKTEIEKQSALDKMKSMTGFESVVDLTERLIAGSYQEKTLREYGLEPDKHPRNIVFTGPSGSGKTTAARLLAAAVSEANGGTTCSSGGAFVELNGRAICGRYLGETRYIVESAVQTATSNGGGVLFIDEAYSLALGDEFGQEAISTLLTAMEQSDLIIIFAGYPDEMENFLNSNPGLRSRIPFSVNFKGYTSDELCTIAMGFLDSKFVVDADAKTLIREHFDSIPKDRLESKDFGLARYSRNVADAISSESARRHWLAGDDAIDISREDVETALNKISETEKPKPTIGFMA